MVARTDDLALIDTARAALAEARTVQDAAELRDQAVAMSRYLKRKEGAEEAALYANEIRLRAERRIGEMLREEGMTCAPVSQVPNGITRKDSSRWQRIASLPEPVFEAALQEPEPTTAGMLRKWKDAQKPARQAQSPTACTAADLHKLAESGRKFGTIYADPPWAYGNQATRASTDNHYGTMSTDDIAALPVGELSAEDSHCHLWTTNGFLREAFDILDAWGFTYKSCFVWVKPQMGIGNYWRVSHEFMLFGLRGKAPFADRGLMSWSEHNRTRHSSKPDAVRGMIEKASPGPYLELFGRATVRGWTVWGDEIQRSLLAHDARTP